MNKEKIELEIQKIQSEGKALYPYARILAMKRGREHPKRHGSIMKYNDGILQVNYDTYAPNLSVHFRDEWVLSFHLGTIKRYIRGDWVTYMKELANPLLLNEEAERLAEERERERKRLESWGL